MICWEIFKYELSYQLSRVWFWFIILLLMALVFLFMRDGSIEAALFSEFYINSPFRVAMATVFSCLLWLVTSAFVAGEAASRDVSSGMHPLTYTMPITKAQYLAGRFFAAVTINAFTLVMLQVAMLLAIYLPGVHPDSLGPLRVEAHLTAYGFIAIPNMLATTVIQFAVALRSGKPISAYMGSFALFFTAYFIAGLILFNSGLGSIIDPIGVRFIWDDLSRLWTNTEKSFRLLTLEGTLLQNRLTWLGLSLGLAVTVYFTFKFAHRTVNVSLWKRFFSKAKPAALDSQHNVSHNTTYISEALIVQHPQEFDLRFQWHQVKEIAWSSYHALVTSVPGLVMLIFIPLLSIPIIIDQMVAMGLPLVPSAPRLVGELTAPISTMSRWMMIPALIIYFTGELVWRERDHRVNDLTDTMPGSSWGPVLGKMLGMAMLLITFTMLLIVAAVLAQKILGYTPTNFIVELKFYLFVMFGLQLPEYLLFAVLTFFIHSLIGHKYVGHFTSILTYAFIVGLARLMGIEHNLLIFSAGPYWSYTDMRAFAPTLAPWLWFKSYWAAWALLMIVGSALVWVRGRETKFRLRLKKIRERLTLATRVAFAVSLTLIAVLGAFILYNTNVLNRYRNSTDIHQLQANYEMLYGKYEKTAQPRAKRAVLHIEFYPDKQTLEIRGNYFLQNTSNQKIDSVCISTTHYADAISFSRKANLVLNDETQNFLIYTLEKPLHPGDSVQLMFQVHVAPHGFTHSGVNAAITKNGSTFNNQTYFPAIGYQSNRALISPAQRKEYGLPERPLLASLSSAHDGDRILFGSDEGIWLETTMGTTDIQMAVAPGDLKNKWTEGNRNYYRYETSQPIGSEWNFFSAPYAVYETQWTSKHHEPVMVRIFYYPPHQTHIEHMMQSVLASLDYYTSHFGPYSYDHLSIVEHPAAPGTGMHADPSLIYYGQGYAHWIPDNENSLDLPYAIMGHEMGHQWTLPYAYAEGLPFLSEGLAWYFSMMLVNEKHDSQQIRKLMRFMRQPYPHQPIRRGEPLLRALDPYLAYKRGPLAMYALTQYASVNSVNAAIRSLNEKSKEPSAKSVTTLDLLNELKTTLPDSTHTLLHELFEVNTLWQFVTDRVSAEKINEKEWIVTLEFTAKKIAYDSAGTITEVPMDEWIYVGLFGARKAGQDELSRALYYEKHRIRSGKQSITIKVSEKPIMAGIDPHHVLDWEEKEDDDNLKAVVTKLND
jgi:ABC-2 type transport system permease protein